MGDVLLVLTPQPILPAHMPAALGHRKRHLSQGWVGNVEHCHCSVQGIWSDCAPRQNQTWLNPHLSFGSYGTLTMSLNLHFFLWGMGVVKTPQNVMMKSAWHIAGVNKY